MLDKIKKAWWWFYDYCIPKFETHLLATKMNRQGDHDYICHVVDLTEDTLYDGVRVTEAFTWLGKVWHLSIGEHFPKENVSINFIDKD